jgi:short-subunit dehydrogenase
MNPSAKIGARVFFINYLFFLSLKSDPFPAWMKDKVVIITGASSGIGLACARAFAERKAKVVLASRSIEKLMKIADEIDPSHDQCMAVKTDVTIESDCKALIEKTVEKFGCIDVLVNNAGISMRAKLDDVKTEVLKRVMDVNFWGTVYCTKYALPYIRMTKGTIAGMSSIAGFHGLPGRSAYSASKFAIHGFLESIRTENYKTGVRICLLAAGFTKSDIRRKALDANGNPQGVSPREEDMLTSPDCVAKNLIRAIRKKKRTRIMSLEGQLMVLFQRIVPSLTDYVIYRKFAGERKSPIK